MLMSAQSIITDLNGTASQGFWVGTSYLLTSASTMPFIAAVSDIFGRPIVLMVSLSTFTLGTILCCTAKTVAILIVGRCIQGIGGGGTQILALVILTDFVPLRYRPKYFAVIQAAWALGTIIGPLVGGAFAQHTTWRWVFYIMFPFCAFGFVAIPMVLTLKPKTQTLKEKLLRVDWIGGFLFITSCTIFLIAISWGGTQEPWSSFRTLVPLILGILGLAATFVWEVYGAKVPFLRHSLFYCPSSFAIYFGTLVQGLILYGQLYYIPLYFLSVKLHGPVHTGVDLLLVLVCLVPASVVIGRLVTRLNSYRWAIWSGWGIATLACGLTIMWDIKTSTAAWAIILVILGFGHGFILNAQNFATQAICQRGDEAAAAAMYSFLRCFGTAIGVGIGGSIFQNVMKTKLTQLGLDTSIARRAESYIFELHSMPPSPYKTQVLEAYVYGLHGVYGGFCGIAGLAGLISLFVKHFDMNRHLESEHKLQENRFTKRLTVSKPGEVSSETNSGVAGDGNTAPNGMSGSP